MKKKETFKERLSNKFGELIEWLPDLTEPFFRCSHVFKVKDNDYTKYICIKCSLTKKRDDIKLNNGGI